MNRLIKQIFYVLRRIYGQAACQIIHSSGFYLLLFLIKNVLILSLTCHWITKQWERKHCVLSMKHFPGQHTSSNILNIFNEILDSWGIEKNKCHVILRDHASNMCKVNFLFYFFTFLHFIFFTFLI